MDQKRQGEIAIRLVKHIMRKQGLRLSHNEMRELGNVAKAIGVPVEELKQFTKLLVQELIDECFTNQ
jgi:hypothetical protein